MGVKQLILEKKHCPRGKQKYDIDLYLGKRICVWKKVLESFCKQSRNQVKFDIKLTVRLQKRQENNLYIYCSPCFRSDSSSVFSTSDIEVALENNLGKILDSFDVFMKQGSGWILKEITASQMNVYLCKAAGERRGKSQD
jgi:hypothetical protein